LLGKPMSLFIFVFDYRATRIFICNSHNHILSLVSPTSDMKNEDEKCLNTTSTWHVKWTLVKIEGGNQEWKIQRHRQNCGSRHMQHCVLKTQTTLCAQDTDNTVCSRHQQHNKEN